MIDSELDEWRKSGQFFQIENHNQFVISQGQGPVLLLLHGFPTSSWDWHKVMPCLANKYRIIAIDMLGYGFSDKPQKGDYQTSSQVCRIIQILRLFDVKKCHLMAYSYGSTVAQELLHQQHSHGIDVHSVCLLNGGLFPGSNHPKLAQRLLMGPFGPLMNRFFNKKTLARNLRAIFGQNTQPPDSLIDQYWSLIEHNDGKTILPQLIQYLQERQELSHRWERALIKATCPIQLIIGDQDSISGISVADEFKRKVSAENVYTLVGIGHYPQIEATDKCLELFNLFQQQHQV